MKRNKFVLLVGTLSLLMGGAGIAAAADPQVAGQQADSSQTASSNATSTQTAPTNQNIDVRIFSPGDAGAVTQTNSSAAASAAVNANTTDQRASQQQAGGAGGTQAAGQAASSDQTASSNATSTQTKPTNSNISVRIDSPGNAGAVTQTNSSAAESAAANLNQTDQSANQTQAGGACCSGTSGGTQAVGQKADSTQDATSSATSTQTKPTNSNIAVRIDSPGNAGAVTQTNSSTAASLAANANKADQSAAQQQAGGACCASGGGTQAVGQAASNDQSATSDATSTQYMPTNQNVPVRIGSPGNDGSVTQTNASVALSAAANLNYTAQTASQSQAGGACCRTATYEPKKDVQCCSGGTGTQAGEQKASNDQSANSEAISTQAGASNINAPVRIASAGGGGTVEQTNASLAASAALNANKLDQSATQNQGSGIGTGVQAIGQFAYSSQDATSDATSTQYKPTNTNAPVRIASKGDDGTVEQTNLSAAESLAANLNYTSQTATQNQAAGTCCKDTKDAKKDSTCCDNGTGVQAIGQKASSDQSADSSADAIQKGASNDNTPVRIGSSGGGGAVSQTNASLAASAALNANKLDQSATQLQGGSLGTGVQAIGQKASNDQSAESNATSTQYKPSNTNAPVRITSYGDDGTVEQTNLSAAGSLAANLNYTRQTATQNQAGGTCCKDDKYDPKKNDGCCDKGTGVQAIGQFATNWQDADSSATSSQYHPSNTNSPVREWSPGNGGYVSQTNASLAFSLALNANKLNQYATQQQGGAV